MLTQLLTRTFETPLGLVLCELISNKNVVDFISKNIYENGWSEVYESSGHRIELVEFKSTRNAHVLDSKCWIFRIEKTNNSQENLEIKCVLTNSPNDTIFDAASGEHLDAIAACNLDWQLNIGTEDEEIMKGRAERNDWLPKRILPFLPITNYLPGYLGLKTELPNLHVGEQIYIQYLSAYDKRNDDNINCWLAVDDLKSTLENWI